MEAMSISNVLFYARYADAYTACLLSRKNIIVFICRDAEKRIIRFINAHTAMPAFENPSMLLNA
jgi:hypothetical protein